MKTVFVDSSVLFTATNSPTGGSAKLFTIKEIKLIVSSWVLTETERNVRAKLHDYHLDRFFNLVGQAQIFKIQPDIKLLQKAQKVIALKDAVILAEAKFSKSDFLVTLDRKDFLNEKVAEFLTPATALTPKDLIAFMAVDSHPKK